MITQLVGVIGSGTFGTAISNLLAENCKVLMYSRNPKIVDNINNGGLHLNVQLSDNIKASNDIVEIAEKTRLIFPIVPSEHFRSMMQDLAPHLRPYHILIHGTKGFDTQDWSDNQSIQRKNVSTMSEVIRQESVVERVGCLSGPNLAAEIIDGQPTATVIGSRFDEVIQLGKSVLKSKNFHVFGSHDILGAELAGALKNIYALGSGVLGGIGMGKNIQALLINRGLLEMVYFGKAMGAEKSAFFGTAGIGDLVATATSKLSRNYTFGFRLGQGESFETIKQTSPELAEGVRTLDIAYHLGKYYRLRVPITDTLYKVVFEGFDVHKAIEFLIRYPYDVDVDFI